MERQRPWTLSTSRIATSNGKQTCATHRGPFSTTSRQNYDNQVRKPPSSPPNGRDSLGSLISPRGPPRWSKCPLPRNSSLRSGERGTGGSGLPHGASWHSGCHPAMDIDACTPTTRRETSTSPTRAPPPVRPSITHARPNKKRRYSLVIPPRTTPWVASNSEALNHVFGEDGQGGQTLALF